MLINIGDFIAGWVGADPVQQGIQPKLISKGFLTGRIGIILGPADVIFGIKTYISQKRLHLGITSLFFSYPFDTIKSRQQAYQITFVKAVKETYKLQGFLGFYSGILSPLLTYGPSNSLFFGVYGNCMRLMHQSEDINHKISLSDYPAINRILLAGTVAGFFQTVLYCPIDYVKVIIQVNSEAEGCFRKYYVPPYKNTYQAIVGIYKTSGLLGYYRGFTPMLIRDGPSGGIYMLIYEMLRHSTLEHVNFLSRVEKEVIAGGTAGLVSIACMIPFDVVKTHIQIDNPKGPYFHGVLDCFYKLYSSHGGKVFFSGLPVTCYRAFPAHAIMFVSYEFVISCF